MNNRYIQRELSWNAFNARVFNEGMRQDVKLLDRMKFMAITCSNYDEFFMVRVARLMRDIQAGDDSYITVDKPPSAILSELLQSVRDVVEKQDKAITEEILPGLAEAGLIVTKPKQWTQEENAQADAIFNNELFPVCTAIRIRPEIPMINYLAQGRIYAAFILQDDSITIIRVPGNLKRFRDLPHSKDERKILLLEDILLSRGEAFFDTQGILLRCLFRVIRDADMSVDEEEDEDFIAAMEDVLESRKTSFPVCLETFGNHKAAKRIRQEILLSAPSHFHLKRPPDFKSFFVLAKLPGFDTLRSRPPIPRAPEDLREDDDIWELLKEKDVLIHSPYESYSPVVRMVEHAAQDSATIAIKMTLYRTSGDSPIVSALINAAERGIQVTVLVELKARFDEGANIHWASRLEQAGAIVIYGLAGFKVHAKILMVLRREEDGIHRYLHLGTGNYNDSTAKLYTDMGLITSRKDFTQDASLVFNAITGYSAKPQLRRLFMGPFSLRRQTLSLIRREMVRVKNGEEGWILAKMNSLADTEIIDSLYEASEAGVQIKLNVRGICALRPGVKGLSENIQVVSIIDAFLEHTRAFSYYNGGNNDVYLSSADWMTRNLDRRVELLFPIPELRHKRRINRILEGYFQDNCRSWTLRPNGHWEMACPGKKEKPFRIQAFLAEDAERTEAEQQDSEHRVLKVRR